MHVEVNETNIAVYELEKLTGNSKEVLLENAEQAQRNGHILYCQIPDREVRVNAFEHFDSEPAPKVRNLDAGDTIEYQDGEGNTIRIDRIGADIVQGEVVEDED